MVETTLLIIGITLLFFAFNSKKTDIFSIIVGAVALYLAYRPPNFADNLVLLFAVFAFSIWVLVDFRRQKLILERLPFVIGLWAYFFFRDEAEKFIKDLVLNFLPENQFPLASGIVVLLIIWFIVARSIKRSKFG